MVGFSKVKLLFGVIGMIWVISAVVISIIGSAIYFSKTGDIKPLLQDTGGMVIGTDSSINLAVNELKKEGITKEYSDYLKQKIIQSLILFVLFSFLIFLIIRGILSFFIPPPMNWGLTSLFILMALILVTLMSVLYNGLMLNSWYFNPFSGITSLVKDYEVLVNVGNESIVKPLIEKITNTTASKEEIALNPKIIDKGNIDILGRPKETIEFSCGNDNHCQSYFQLNNAICEVESGICYVEK